MQITNITFKKTLKLFFIIEYSVIIKPKNFYFSFNYFHK